MHAPELAPLCMPMGQSTQGVDADMAYMPLTHGVHATHTRRTCRSHTALHDDDHAVSATY